MSHPPPLPAPLYQGCANAWECDEGGHLNIRFHFERALSGLAQFALALELPRAFTAAAGATLIPLEAHARFLREALPGAPLVMHGGVIRLEESEALVCLDMRHSETGAPASAFTLRIAHADTRDFKSFPWSSRTRAAAKRLACKPPEHAKPRSIDPKAAPAPAISAARARELGAKRIGAAIVTPDQCDAFGRLRGEHLIGRVSDSVPNLLAQWRAEAAGAGAVPAGAVVEARVVFRRWPRAGELITVHSGVIEVGQKTLRLAHWLCDPETGAGWASMEALALTFDTATRKTIAPSPEARAAMAAQIVAMSI